MYGEYIIYIAETLFIFDAWQQQQQQSNDMVWCESMLFPE